MRSFLYDFVCFRTNQKLSHCTQTFSFLNGKKKNNTTNEQSDSAVSQNDDDNLDNNHNEKDALIESTRLNMSKKLLLDKMAIFKMIPENECENSK